MLVLTRKDKESIYLGDNIRLDIVEISRGLVKIGIDAPKDVLILRGELKNKIEKENIKANLKVNDLVVKDLSRLLKK